VRLERETKYRRLQRKQQSRRRIFRQQKTPSG